MQIWARYNQTRSTKEYKEREQAIVTRIITNSSIDQSLQQ